MFCAPCLFCFFFGVFSHVCFELSLPVQCKCEIFGNGSG